MIYMNLVFIILYILLDDEASINANHSWVNIYFSFWLQALTNQVLFVKPYTSKAK